MEGAVHSVQRGEGQWYRRHGFGVLAPAVVRMPQCPLPAPRLLFHARASRLHSLTVVLQERYEADGEKQPTKPDRKTCDRIVTRGEAEGRLQVRRTWLMSAVGGLALRCFALALFMRRARQVSPSCRHAAEWPCPKGGPSFGQEGRCSCGKLGHVTLPSPCRC